MCKSNKDSTKHLWSEGKPQNFGGEKFKALLPHTLQPQRQKPTKIVMIDLSRTSAPVDGKDYLGGMYSLCEHLKNGVLMSTKYESMSVQFAVPHVIIFANWEPDYTKWSPDRYDVTNLSELSYAPP
jgi:hypothetical protein